MFADSILTDPVAVSGDPFQDVKLLLADVLQLGPRVFELLPETQLLGNLPELDSMAVVTLISALEAQFGFLVDDDDNLASAFATLQSLVDYVNQKLADECRPVA